MNTTLGHLFTTYPFIGQVVADQLAGSDFKALKGFRAASTITKELIDHSLRQYVVTKQVTHLNLLESEIISQYNVVQSQNQIITKITQIQNKALGPNFKITKTWHEGYVSDEFVLSGHEACYIYENQFIVSSHSKNNHNSKSDVLPKHCTEARFITKSNDSYYISYKFQDELVVKRYYSKKNKTQLFTFPEKYAEVKSIIQINDSIQIVFQKENILVRIHTYLSCKKSINPFSQINKLTLNANCEVLSTNGNYCIYKNTEENKVFLHNFTLEKSIEIEAQDVFTIENNLLLAASKTNKSVQIYRIDDVKLLQPITLQSEKKIEELELTIKKSLLFVYTKESSIEKKEGKEEKIFNAYMTIFNVETRDELVRFDLSNDDLKRNVFSLNPQKKIQWSCTDHLFAFEAGYLSVSSDYNPSDASVITFDFSIIVEKFDEIKKIKEKKNISNKKLALRKVNLADNANKNRFDNLMELFRYNIKIVNKFLKINKNKS